VDRADIAMKQRSGGACLAQETLHHFGIVVELGHLERHLAVELTVSCEIDNSHRTFAEYLFDAIATEGFGKRSNRLSGIHVSLA